jgi:uncharacterized protein YhfF
LHDKLVASILRGDKTTTTGLHEEFVREGTPVPAVGERSLVADSDGKGVAVIETRATAQPLVNIERRSLQVRPNDRHGLGSAARPTGGWDGQ